MSESVVVLDELSAGGAELPVIAQPAPLDILDRQEFVDRVFNLIEVIASQRGSCSFAIDGAWGSGKTFVLNMLEPKLRDYKGGDKYLVFHYNCWQYDYYEEPLVAIVSALLDTLTNSKLVKAEAVLDGVLTTLKGITDDLMSLIFNVKLFEHVDAGKKKAAEVEAAPHSFDQYFGFKKVMTEARTALKQLAEGKTLVIVVDELDRCLPQYAIKVLERLHHLFSELENSVVILGVDRHQLQNTVKQTFGPDTPTDEYLRKFINLRLTLDKGKITSGFFEKHYGYTSMFDKDLPQPEFNVEEFIAVLFAGIEIRIQEQIIETLRIAHSTLFGNEKRDYMFMCFELLWAVFSKYYRCDHSPFTYDHSEEYFNIKTGALNADLLGGSSKPKIHGDFIAYYQELCEGMPHAWESNYTYDRKRIMYTMNHVSNNIHLLVWYFEKMFESKNSMYLLESNLHTHTPYKDTVEEFRSFTKFLALLK